MEEIDALDYKQMKADLEVKVAAAEAELEGLSYEAPKSDIGVLLDKAANAIQDIDNIYVKAGIGEKRLSLKVRKKRLPLPREARLR